MASLIVGFVTVRALTGSLIGTKVQTRMPRLRWSGTASYLLQSLACAMNDGQKMLAVVTLLLGAKPETGLGNQAFTQAVLGVSFTTGTLVGISRVAGRLNQSVVPVRAVHSIASESAAGMAVLVSSALGTPVLSAPA